MTGAARRQLTGALGKGHWAGRRPVTGVGARQVTWVEGKGQAGDRGVGGQAGDRGERGR